MSSCPRAGSNLTSLESREFLYFDIDTLWWMSLLLNLRWGQLIIISTLNPFLSMEVLNKEKEIVNAYFWVLCSSMQYRCLNWELSSWGSADCEGVAARLWSAELIVSKLISANATLPRHWWWMSAVTTGCGAPDPRHADDRLVWW